MYEFDNVLEIVSIFWANQINATCAVINYDCNEWTIEQALTYGKKYIERTPVPGQTKVYVKTVLLRELEEHN